MFIGKFKSGFGASGEPLGTPLAPTDEIVDLLRGLKNKGIIAKYTLYNHENSKVLQIGDYLVIPDFQVTYLVQNREIIYNSRQRGIYKRTKLFHPMIELWDKTKVSKFKQLLGDING